MAMPTGMRINSGRCCCCCTFDYCQRMPERAARHALHFFYSISRLGACIGENARDI